MMNPKKIRIPILILCAFLTFGCVYIELPQDLATPQAPVGSDTKGWNAVATEIKNSDSGDLRIFLTIQNETDDWSTMQSAADKPAILTTSDGKKTNCDTVFVNTGEHRLAPGFQMRGYSTGKMEEPETQLIYVECKGADAVPGSKLSIDYVAYGGILDDYTPDANETEGTLEIDLDKINPDLVYPIATPVEGLIQEPGVSITGLSDNVVTLLDTTRTDTGLEFTWQNFNPSKFPLKTHIGTPPVIGADGILYGVYESLDIAPIPITPPKGNMQWTTGVKVPQDVKGLHILLSVETNKPRTYKSYVLDITDK
jgi:hypothetical protein